jgi:hypothetical protein
MSHNHPSKPKLFLEFLVLCGVVGLVLLLPSILHFLSLIVVFIGLDIYLRGK